MTRSRILALAASGMLLLGLALGLTQCGFNRPKVDDAKYNVAMIDHANFTTSCIDCHVPDRPAPVDQTPHGNNLDCNTCHRFIAADPQWLSRQQFSHVPAPTSCLSCHGSLRPKAPPHPDTTADCAACHAFPSFLSPINQ